mmetsp:Transcript_73978/g.204146  ORF Transcript_73978/g.204146 Transcript_73978/m.204146 type:complete len:245 (-) Transcript_73978:479-1213(-)
MLFPGQHIHAQELRQIAQAALHVLHAAQEVILDWITKDVRAGEQVALRLVFASPFPMYYMWEVSVYLSRHVLDVLRVRRHNLVPKSVLMDPGQKSIPRLSHKAELEVRWQCSRHGGVELAGTEARRALHAISVAVLGAPVAVEGPVVLAHHAVPEQVLRRGRRRLPHGHVQHLLSAAGCIPRLAGEDGRPDVPGHAPLPERTRRRIRVGPTNPDPITARPGHVLVGDRTANARGCVRVGRRHAV